MKDITKLKDHIIIALEDVGDDLTGFKKGDRFKPMMVYTNKNGERVYKLLTGNGVYANVPAKHFGPPQDIAFLDNPLFGSF